MSTQDQLTREIVGRLTDEADQCINDGADDIAGLLMSAASRIVSMHEQIAALLEELDAKTEALRPAPAQPMCDDSARLDWLRDNLFVHRWNGVIGDGSTVQWQVKPLAFAARSSSETGGIRAGDFRRAINTARGITAQAGKALNGELGGWQQQTHTEDT